MNELLDKYNYQNVKITLLDVEYFATLFKKNKELLIKITDQINIEKARKIKLIEKFPLINGMVGNKDITFFGLTYNSILFSSESKTADFTFKLDKFIENMKYMTEIDNKIKNVTVEFYGLENFSVYKFYDYDENFNPIFENKHSEFDLGNFKLKVFINNNITADDFEYKCEKKLYFAFDYKTKQKLDKVIKDIWILKCFLAVLSKKIIGIKSIKINNVAKLFMNLIYFEDKVIEHEILVHDYKRFVLNLEDIEDNFEKIYLQFIKIFNQIMPALEIYINMIESDCSRMNRFLNCTQIIEYISRQYDESNAEKIRCKYFEKTKNKKISLANRIESLIEQTNYIWNLENEKIQKISKRIANGRNYYNHHLKTIKPLSNDETYFVSYFSEDVILGYLYEKMGISRKIINLKLQDNIYYELDEIKKM